MIHRKLQLIPVDPQPDFIESSGRWRWPLPQQAQFPGCCTEVVTASREWWEYAPSEAKPHHMAEGVMLRDNIWYWAVPMPEALQTTATRTVTPADDGLVDSCITLTAQALRDALELANPDGPGDADQLETEVTILWMSARISVDGEPMPAGLYAYLADCPEEGAIGPLGVQEFSESSENSTSLSCKK